MLESPCRTLTGPLVGYIDDVERAHPGHTWMMILPEYVPGHWWEHLLHNQTALRIKGALLFRRGVITTSVPYHLRDEERPRFVAR